MDSYQILSQIAQGAILIPFALSILWYQRFDRNFKVLCWLVWATTVAESIELYLTYNEHDNHLLTHIFPTVEFSLLSLIYMRWLSDLQWKWVILILGVAFPVFSLINVFWLQGPGMLNTHGISLETLLLIAYSILYFGKIVRDMEIQDVEKDATFWLNSGVLFYFSGMLFLLVLSSNMLKLTTEVQRNLGIIHTVNSFAINLFYTTALWFSSRR